MGELPTDERSFIPARAEASSDPLGLRLEDLNDENSQASDPEEGVVVTRVTPGSSASGKIMRGDIITDVIVSGDRKPVIDIDSFEEIVDSLSSGDKIALVGRRSGNRFFVAITVD